MIKIGYERDHRQNKKTFPCPHPDLERMRSQSPVLRIVFCLRWIKNFDWGNGPNSKNILNIALAHSPGAVVYQNYYKGHYKRKTTTHVIML
jgi:hypothetical protein